MKSFLLFALVLGAVALSLHGADLSPGTSTAPVNLPTPMRPSGLKEPVASYWDAAVKGSGDAAYNLGVSYENGNGVPQDNAQAEFWFRRAVAEGNSWAETSLGKMYTYGTLGHDVDLAKARAWFAQAARDHDPEGQYFLAYFMVQGMGGAADQKEGIQWAVRSASGGYGRGAFFLASSYQHGYSAIPRNPPLAYLWSLRATDSGDLDGKGASANDDLQKGLETSLAASDIMWLKQRRDEIKRLQKRFDYLLVDDGLEESVTVPPEGTVQESLNTQVHFEGKDDHPFFVDTGSTSSVITPELAHKLGLREVGLTALEANPPILCPVVVADGEIGGTRFQNLRFTEVELPPDFKDRGIEGTLGCNFLRFLRLKIDGGSQVSFQPPGPGAGGGLPIVFQNGCPHIAATVVPTNDPGFTVSAMIDCGNSALPSMNSALSLKHPFPGLFSRTVPYTAESAGGITPSRLGRLASLKLGPFEVRQPLLAYQPESADELNIGMSVLGKFSATFDYPDARLYLTPKTSDVPEPPYFDLGYAYSQAGWDAGIEFVSPGGPAEKAGFQVGDVVESIDGHEMKKTTPAEREAIYQPGTHQYVIKRNGEEKTLTLVLEPGI